VDCFVDWFMVSSQPLSFVSTFVSTFRSAQPLSFVSTFVSTFRLAQPFLKVDNQLALSLCQSVCAVHTRRVSRQNPLGFVVVEPERDYCLRIWTKSIGVYCQEIHLRCLCWKTIQKK